VVIFIIIKLSLNFSHVSFGNAIKKYLLNYLNKYAELEVSYLEDFPQNLAFNHVVVIPAFDETDNFYHRLMSSNLASSEHLLILVINCPSDLTTVEEKVSSVDLYNSVSESCSLIWNHGNLSLLKHHQSDAFVLVINRFSDGLEIPKKQGVGLARKIGVDVATSLISHYQIKSSWICTTDADAILPSNYFSVLKKVSTTASAINYEFCHQENDSEISNATQYYQRALRYYVAGLKWAKSPYAYHSIGSTLAINVEYYAKVRGFPKRAGGEDFYLLNKLIKLAPIVSLKDSIVEIMPRTSHRVPFGTGPAISSILSKGDPENNYHYYHPKVFDELKSSLIALTQLFCELDQTSTWENRLSVSSLAALKSIGLNSLYQHLQSNTNTEQQASIQIRIWFDAFKTLKFIHHLQHSQYPAMPLMMAIKQAQFK